MGWMFGILILAAVITAGRVLLTVRRARAQTHDDWDARLVQNLRAAGGNSFTPYEVDFFFNLPTEAACAALGGTIGAEGFAIDSRLAVGEGASGYSLHARKLLRVSVTEMQEYSQRFRSLAEQHGGHYDGWMTDPSRQ